MGLGVVHVSDTFTDCGAVEEGGSSQELLGNEEVLNNVFFFVFFFLGSFHDFPPDQSAGSFTEA